MRESVLFVIDEVTAAYSREGRDLAEEFLAELSRRRFANCKETALTLFRC